MVILIYRYGSRPTNYIDNEVHCNGKHDTQGRHPILYNILAYYIYIYHIIDERFLKWNNTKVGSNGYFFVKTVIRTRYCAGQRRVHHIVCVHLV